jgi:hypothetical protein
MQVVPPDAQSDAAARMSIKYRPYIDQTQGIAPKMSDKPNPEDFSRDEKPRQYRACFYVQGEVWMDIEADSEDEARAKAEAMAEEDGFGTDLDEVDDIDLSYVTKTSPMYRITRDDRAMQVSRLEPGDLPREPRPDGF